MIACFTFRSFFLAALFLVLPFGSHPQPAHSTQPTIIFDLGGVLLEPNNHAVMKELGMGAIVAYMIRHQSSPHAIKQKLYHVLDNIDVLFRDLDHLPWENYLGNTCGARDGEGTLLPHIMCDWLRGTPAEKIRKTVLSLVKVNRHWFASSIEYTLVCRLIRMIFTPERFAHTIKVSRQGVAFVRLCKKNGYRVAILSNWDRDSFVHIKSRLPELFDLFEDEDILASGDIGAIKPDIELFGAIRQRFGTASIFVDDQHENIKNALRAGLIAIRCPQKTGLLKLYQSPNFAKVKAHMKELKHC